MGNGRPSTTCDVAYTDCRSIGAQEKLSQMMQAEDAMMYTSQRRYFFYLPEFRGAALAAETDWVVMLLNHVSREMHDVLILEHLGFGAP